ncbi:Ankyrin_repeat-containing protein [Hexamita inflata]|uniref:Ankyrin_repeat-containing protein n=1 Tax=Hexamita inflata TaxID=28002 RepID=A0ABP1L2A8_9EUKA
MNELMLAATIGDIDKLRSILDQFNEVDEFERTALMLAVLRGNDEAVDLLCENESQSQDDNGFTALMLACLVRNQYAARRLIQEEAGMVSYTGLSALMCAAISNFVQIVPYLIEKEAALQTDNGQTALMLASAQNNIDIVMLLQNKEMNLTDQHGMTASMYAAASAHPDILRLLLKEVPIQDKDGNSVLLHSLNAHNVLKQLKESESLQYRERIMQCANLVFDSQKDLKSADGATALMMSAKYGIKSMVEKVLNQSRTQTIHGRTSLMLAAKYNQMEVIPLLKQEIRMQDNQGRSAAIYAAEYGSFDALEELYSNEQEIKDNQGCCLLHYAAKGEQIEIMQLLRKDFLHVKDLFGRTAAMSACETDAVKSLEFLHEIIDVKDKQEKTCLMAAAKYDSVNCVNYLIKSQKNKQSIDKRNATIIAAQYDSYNSFLTLLSHEKISKTGANSIFTAVLNNSFKTLKLICDVARIKTSPLINNRKCSGIEIEFCRNLLTSKTSKLDPFPDGFDPLIVAVSKDQSDAVRILSLVLTQSSYKGVTPLMLVAQRDLELNDKALLALCQSYGGKCLKSNYNWMIPGQTALMIACLAKVENQKLIKMLKPYEINNVDEKGQSALDYAKAADRVDIIELLKEE